MRRPSMNRRSARLVLLGGVSFVAVAWLVVLSLYSAIPDARPVLRAPRAAPRAPRQARPTAAPAAVAKSVAFAAPPEVRERLVRGAVGEAQERYQKLKEEEIFRCFDGSKSFASFAVVNDDYCDCLDGSDEPGTAACSSSGSFACNWERGEGPFVHLSTVNDGICDCCAGQDEAPGTCPDRCAELEAAAAQSASLALEGSRAREVLLRRGAKLRTSERFKGVDGGPDSALLAVAEEGCLKLNDADFEFEVCLFDKATQRDLKSGKKFVLGHKGKWATSLWENGQHRIDYTKLVMENGDFCAPAHKHREVEINFECAAKSSLLSVQETQVCSYTARMQTPAACPDRSS